MEENKYIELGKAGPYVFFATYDLAEFFRRRGRLGKLERVVSKLPTRIFEELESIENMGYAK